MIETALPDTLVKVKMSHRTHCKRVVCVSIEHLMGKDSDFWKDVKKYKLNVSTIPLLEYRKLDFKFCECKH